MSPQKARFRIDRVAPDEDGGAWAAALSAFEPRSARTLKEEGGAAVYGATMLGRDVIVKVRDLRGVGERLKVAVGAGRGRRHWSGARWLKSQGILTAEPYALATGRGGAEAREWLVLEALVGKTLLQHIADRDLPVRMEHEVARRLARQVNAISRAGRFNRDHKPSNLILVPGDEGPIPAVIDCVALRPGAGQTARMVHSLAVEPLGLGIMPRRAFMARFVHTLVEAEFAGTEGSLSAAVRSLAKRASRRAYWEVVSDSLRRHGDTVPRVNPLSPPRTPR